ncbi:MAG TPA: heavy-metal-associated domain-containing protein [Beutenbergiaceae bacterium]|nr:heavy-metal-associated domain-containing protein [Beutenbergiaceae bacterium]
MTERVLTIEVAGMTCTHCVAHVTAELHEVDGVQNVSVDLRPGQDTPVQVFTDQHLDEASLRAAVDEAGYTVTSIHT